MGQGSSRQLVEELQRTRESLAALLEHTTDFILVCDATGSPVMFNEAYRRLMKEAGIEMRLGLRPHTLLSDPEEVAWWERLHQRVLAGETFRVEYRRVFSGEDRYFELAFNPITRNGAVVGFTEMTRDITERKRMEQALRGEKDRAQRYLDVAGVIIVVLDMEGRVSLINRKGCEVLGLEEDQIVGSDWFETFLPPRMRQEVRAVFNRVMTGKATTEPELDRYENPILIASGEERLVAWTNVVLRDTAGTACGTLSSGEDITDRRRAEEERATILGQLHQAQKMEAMGNLAGGVAHDVNNVLTSIAGLASLLLENATPDDPIRADLQSILSSCDRGHDLTRNLLGFARKGKFRTERISLNEVVRDVVELLGRTIPKSVTMLTALEAGLPEIEGDAAQIEHVIINLALNAADAMHGKGTLTFTTERTSDRVRLRVTDTGEGMDAETRARVFEPFFTTKAPGEGTGLGLSMVYGTVTNHNGEISLHSTPGHGTTVEILLPALPRSGPRPATTGAHRQLPRGDGTVLLVDDEPTVRTTTQRMLEKLGFTVLIADNGARAVALFEEHSAQISFVILDVMMPGMDGAETFDALRSVDPGVKVLVSSGYFREELAAGLLARGAVGFLQKPYRLAALAEELKRALG